MALPRNQKLRQKASLAMRTGDFDAALRIYRELEQKEPNDPIWPERCAVAYHELGQSRNELGCLRRALDLHVEQGQVLPAIATCKLILDIRPDDEATLDCLHLLYAEPSLNPRENVALVEESTPLPVRPPAPRTEPAADAPLEELQLTEVIPDARAAQLGDGETEGVAEIPLEDTLGELDPGVELDVDFVDEVRAAPNEPTDPAAESTPFHRDARARQAREELTRTPLFGSLDVTALHELVSQVSVVRLAAGEELFHEGDAADTLYVVVEGAVVPIAEGPPRQRLAVLEKGEFFGEIGLVTNQPRNATIEALVETKLLAIDRAVMWSLIRGRSEMSKVLLRFLRERLIDRTVRTHPFFSAFARAELGSVARQFRFLEVTDGAPVLEQGLESEGLFVLLAGEMDVVDEVSDKVLGRLGPGDVFGGIALVSREPAVATVIASGKCWVLVLEGPRFRRILAGRPRVEDQLAALASRSGSGRPIV